MSNRVITLRSLLADKTTKVVIQNSKDLFSLRLVQTTTKATNAKPNMSIALVNAVCFAEDVWFALGLIPETFSMARQDLSSTAIELTWRENLSKLLAVCNVNLHAVRKLLTTSRNDFHEDSNKLSSSKAIALFSVLLTQEADFVQIVCELLQAHGLDSARESWSGRYQVNSF